jgi:hypothetical protein
MQFHADDDVILSHEILEENRKDAKFTRLRRGRKERPQRANSLTA